MKAISNSLGVSYLRETTIKSRRKILRRSVKTHTGLSFGQSTLCAKPAVLNQVKALESGDFEEFKRHIIESGHCRLNIAKCLCNRNVAEQGYPCACLAQGMLSGHGAEVHGGGFAERHRILSPLPCLTSSAKRWRACSARKLPC